MSCSIGSLSQKSEMTAELVEKGKSLLQISSKFTEKIKQPLAIATTAQSSHEKIQQILQIIKEKNIQELKLKESINVTAKITESSISWILLILIAKKESLEKKLVLLQSNSHSEEVDNTFAMTEIEKQLSKISKKITYCEIMKITASFSSQICEDTPFKEMLLNPQNLFSLGSLLKASTKSHQIPSSEKIGTGLQCLAVTSTVLVLMHQQGIF